VSETIAIIPARGGSKGIPGKNIIEVAGAPLVAHSIGHARAATSIDRVFVSTDDAEIARISAAHGAEIIERPAELGSDQATSESALHHAVGHYVAAEGVEPGLIVFLQATSPLRRADDIDRAVGQLRRTGADSLLSAHRLHTFVWQQRDDELASLTYDHRHRRRRQDLETVEWMENGSIYVFKPWVLRELDNRLGGRIEVFEMDVLTSFQVDEPTDLDLIELLAPAVARSDGDSVPDIILTDAGRTPTAGIAAARDRDQTGSLALRRSGS